MTNERFVCFLVESNDKKTVQVVSLFESLGRRTFYPIKTVDLIFKCAT